VLLKYDWSSPVSRKKAFVLLIAAAILWSSGGLLIKLVDWSPLAIAGARSALAALTIFLLTGKQLRFNWTAIQIGGALAYAGTVAFFVLATKLTTAANAILLQYTAPLYVAILGFWFLRERTNPFDWLIVFLTLCGIFLFFLDDLSPGNLLGNGFAALSGLCFGLFILCMRKQEDSSPMATVLLGNLVTAAAGLPFMFHTAPPDLAGWGALLLLGIFQLGLSYICYAIAVRSVTALEAVLIPVIEPLLNPLWVLLFVGETPGPWALAGGLIVVISITAHSAVKTLKGAGP
jgi:drug/metabolite transporter (DMT)-like permease